MSGCFYKVQKKNTFPVKIITVLFLIFNFVLPGICGASDNKSNRLDTVVVTGTWIPQSFSDTPQTISIISHEEIMNLPAGSVTDILEYVNGVDVKQRGAHGVQADVGIRGSSYEQTLILIDGITMNDPQTGHHNMDLPVNIEVIDRIEVLKGPGARIYGPNAMGGVINIITRDMDKNKLGGYMKFGEHHLLDTGAQGVYMNGNISNRVSASLRSSTGHIRNKDTDFDIRTVNYKGKIKNGSSKLNLGFGYTDKDFGAYKFYSDTYPDQREETESLLFYSSADFKIGDVKVIPKIHWKRHNDKFKILIGNTWNHNDHETEVIGALINTNVTSSMGDTSVGYEFSTEDMKSSNMGNHDRYRNSLFFEHKFYPAEILTVGFGMSAVYYSNWGWEYWPGADINFELSENLNWFGSCEKSFRVPTFTDLYYNTPANQGDPTLKPEQAWAYETGMRWIDKVFNAELSLFYRDSENIIDWTRLLASDPWQVRNISESTTKGAEIALELFPESFLNTNLISIVKFAYTYLDIERNTSGLESKYSLDQIRHQLNGTFIMDWFKDMKHTVSIRYGKRMTGDEHTIVDSRLAYTLNDYEVFLEATNIFDVSYIESGFAPMPDSWLIFGVKVNL